MAAESCDRAVAARFLRDLARHPAATGPEPGMVGAAAAIEGTSPATVLGSGWRRLEGVLVLGAGPAPGGERPALAAATNLRALRELLLALPRGELLRLRLGLAWHLGPVAEMLDGSLAPGAEGCFVGVKRGGGAAPAGPPGAAGGDPPLSRRDTIVDLLRDLAQPRGRAEHGRFVAEGPTLVRRAIDGGLPVEAVAHTAGLLRAPEGAALLDAARAAGVPCRRASDGLMGTLTPTRPLPAVLAAVHLRLLDASDLSPGQAATVLVAENLRNPDNLGLVLRTADAAGVEAVVVAGEGTDPLHRNCVRAARGAVGRIPILRCDRPAGWTARLRERGFQVVGATAHGDVGVFDADLRPPIAVVVGNEELGISPETLAACGARVAIPMAPGQDSLNVGVAAGVVLFELLRRREAGGA